MILLTGHMNFFRVWENAIIFMDFELVTWFSGYVPESLLNMNKKKLEDQLLAEHPVLEEF